MNQDSSLLTLLKTYLKNYEHIDESIYTIIQNYINNGKDPNTSKKIDIDSIPDVEPAQPEDSDCLWRTSLTNLIHEFNQNFGILRNETEEHKQTYLKYANQMKIILNKSRINIQDLNDNFSLISTGFNAIFDELFSVKTTAGNKYLSMFNGIIKELIPLWESIMYLWLAFLLKERDKVQKPVVKFVYTESADTSVIVSEIKSYIDEYPDSHLCIIPIVKINNYYQNYYSEQGYPGIFYHAPNFNSQVFKCEKKFIFYPFNTLRGSSVGTGLMRAGCNNDNIMNNLYLGHSVYGHKILVNDLYYAAPLDEISSIKEIFPKTYYSQIRMKPSYDFYVYNGTLYINNLIFDYFDVLYDNISGTENIIGTYNTNYITLSLAQNLDELKQNYSYCRGATIYFNQNLNVTQRSCPLTKKTNFRKFNLCLTGFDKDCICAPITSIEEDYSYLIEYVPLAATTGAAIENNNNLITEEDLSVVKSTYVGSSSDVNSLYNKDNDLLEQHYNWDNDRNNIIEDKLVLRIGQHWECDAYIYDSLPDAKKALIPNDCKTSITRDYFDYGIGTQIITEKSSNINYYNKGTVDVGAYLNIPFIKNKKKRVTYYPDFLSHTYGSDNLIPLTSIEYFNDTQTKPEYFSYDKLYRDYPINKNTYFQIYTEDGDNNFEGNWCIKMIEVISQKTPKKESYFSNGILPPTSVATMEQLYNYYNTYKNNINTNVLPYFSQLNPDSNIDIDTSIIAGSMIGDFRGHIKLKFQSLVNFFTQGEGYYPSSMFRCYAEYAAQLPYYEHRNYLTATEANTYKARILDFIADSLLMPQVHIAEERLVMIGSPYKMELPAGDDKICYMPLTILTTTTILENYKDMMAPDYPTWRNFDADALRRYKEETGHDDAYALDHQDEWSIYQYIISEKNSDGEYLYGALTEYPYMHQQDFSGYYNKSAHKSFKSDSSPVIPPTKSNYMYWSPQVQEILNLVGKEEAYSNLDTTDYVSMYCGIAPLDRCATVEEPPTSGVQKYTLEFRIFGMNIPFYNYSTSYVSHLYYSVPNGNGGYYIDTLSYTVKGKQRKNGYSSTLSTYRDDMTLLKTNSDEGFYYSIINLGKYFFQGAHYAFLPCGIPSELRSSFFEISSYSNKSCTVKSRQYPHIFLSNNKTLFPNNSYFNSTTTNNTRLKIYKTSGLNNLKNYYSKINTTINKNSLPYPFPTKAITTTKTRAELKQQGTNSLKDLWMKDPPMDINLNWAFISGSFTYNSYNSHYVDKDILNMNIFKETFEAPYTYYLEPGNLTIYAPNTPSPSTGENISGTSTSDLPGTNIIQEKAFNTNIVIKDENEQVITSDNITSTNYQNDIGINVESPLELNLNNTQTGEMNLQIIIHYFGPNGAYTRKIKTRDCNGIVNNENHFVLDGTKELTYREWKNTWTESISNQSIYNNFISSLSSLEIFKESSTLEYQSGGTTHILDFETYPNNGKTL